MFFRSWDSVGHLVFQLCISRSQIFAMMCEKSRRGDVNIFAQNLGISGDPCNERNIFNFAKWQVMSKFFGVFLGPCSRRTPCPRGKLTAQRAIAVDCVPDAGTVPARRNSCCDTCANGTCLLTVPCLLTLRLVWFCSP